ncbi:intradiol ring-cleavage dioxygenase [Pinibacter soli]|uniref:Intradiol ring-cleavage dioxygenase n=1 Tax=Pinibacter soli TaxID=3044211 RepID=A0ABT6RG27_9BACT|nr:intradiol ring-cleavage dioxygenase [Pinibacter soli]MDI3321515.1 intradiol ring-cleavage dioxygenase [Pinibacter soli]
MDRKLFVKHAFSALGIVAVAPLVNACSKNDSTTNSSAGSSGSSSDVTTDTSCSVSPTETEGPFPTKQPSSYVRSDITKGDGIGSPLTAKITIVNGNNNCTALAGAIVDIWHCDVDGNYSEYGGTQMQSTNFQSVHWLRGRQVTDANGLVTFKSIFPGWYQGRATHIHVHVYNASGTSLLVTQIAFPDALAITVNSTGSAYGYAKGTSGYTYNNADNVFSDSVAKEMATVTGSVDKGFDLSITIKANA